MCYWVLIQFVFTASFVSCDETSVHICGQTAVESTGCIHVSCVQGVAQAVYILDQVRAVFSPDWYMSCEHSSSSFSKHLSQGFLYSREPVMRQLCKGVCVCVSRHIQESVHMRASCLDAVHSTCDPSPRCWMV